MSEIDFSCLLDKGIWRQNFFRIFQDGRHNQYELFVLCIFFQKILSILVSNRAE